MANTSQYMYSYSILKPTEWLTFAETCSHRRYQNLQNGKHRCKHVVTSLYKHTEWLTLAEICSHGHCQQAME